MVGILILHFYQLTSFTSDVGYSFLCILHITIITSKFIMIKIISYHDSKHVSKFKGESLIKTKVCEQIWQITSLIFILLLNPTLLCLKDSGAELEAIFHCL